MVTPLNEKNKEKQILKTIEKISKFLKDTILLLKFNGYILGVSGGIDSAVCAALIKKACPNNLKTYYLDCENSKLDLECVNQLNEKFQLNCHYVELTSIYKFYLETLNMKKFSELAKGNFKSRLRMSTLYAYANQYNSLVVGTTNKCEKYLGYFTKFGDGAYDISLLSDFNKSEIMMLAKLLNVPEIIIKRAPTAGLFEGQTDEKEIGQSYQDIDKFLNNELSDEVKCKAIIQMHRKNSHKSNLAIKPDLSKILK